MIIPNSAAAATNPTDSPGQLTSSNSGSPGGGALLGRTPAERLAVLLMQELPASSKAYHLARLANEGKKGGEREQLTEWVLNEDERKVLDALPQEICASLAIEHAGLPDAKRYDGEAAKDAILTWLGFPVSLPPRGLPTFKAELERLRAKALLEPKLQNEQVMAGSRILEELLNQLIAFHVGAFLGPDIDAQLQDMPGVRQGRTLAELGLGELIFTASRIRRELRRCEAWTAQFGLRHLLPSGADKVLEPRNRAAHNTGREGSAADFFATSLRIIEHLADGAPALAPIVLLVEERIDSGKGRRYEGKDDRGWVERIHTDAELQLGKLYYMLPHSNPVRVFPTVVAAR